MITIIQANILDATEKYIGHQVNCVSKNAAGVAAVLFAHFPYSDIYSNRTHNDFPGHIIISGNGKNERLILNLLAQYHPGKPNPNSTLDNAKAREGYFWQCLLAISKIDNVESVALPFGVGCGLAGGNWDNYYRMLKNFDLIINQTQRVETRLYKLGQ